MNHLRGEALAATVPLQEADVEGAGKLSIHALRDLLRDLLRKNSLSPDAQGPVMLWMYHDAG